MIRITAPAKINLFLRILAREESGFHQLETAFQALELGDVLALKVKGEGIRLLAEGPAMGPLEDNLAYRAARAFREVAGIQDGVEIRLEKRIPVQGGLGGGSSDAAAVLRAMDHLFPDCLDEAGLVALASKLGSDVPFFLSPSPFALAWGRGDRLLGLPALPGKPVILASPPLGVDTGEAYAMLAQRRRESGFSGFSRIFRLSDLGDWASVARLAENNFEDVVFSQNPLLARLKEALRERGPEFALLSGSGSSLFAVFQEEDVARHARRELAAAYPDCRFILTHSLERFPDPISHPGVER